MSCCCRIGAALVVDSHIIPEVFSRLANNPLCVFISENRTQEPNEWNVRNGWEFP